MWKQCVQSLLIGLCLTQCVLCLTDCAFALRAINAMIDISMRRIVRKTKRHVMALTSMSSWYVSTPGAKMHLTAFFQGFDNFEELKCLIVKHALTVGKGNWIGMWAKNRLLDWFDSKGSWGWAFFNSVIQTLSHGKAQTQRHCHTCKTHIGHKQPSPLVP